MIGETSKLTLSSRPNANEKRIPAQSRYKSWLAGPGMSLSQSQKFSDTPSYATSISRSRRAASVRRRPLRS